MNWRLWWARLSPRERTLIGLAGGVLGLLLVRFLIVSPFFSYRESLQDEITSHREMLQNDHAYLARASDISRRLQGLRARYAEVRTQLVPGDTPTLAAASLQDTLHSLATEKNINIQSTQVMHEETVGDFRRIAVRITITGELRDLAGFLAGIEYGPRHLTVSFLEISRKGAVLRGQSARALAATVEVNAFLRDSDASGAKVESAAAQVPDEAGAAQPLPSASEAPQPDVPGASPGAPGAPDAGGKPTLPDTGGRPVLPDVPPQAHGVGRMASASEGVA